MQGPSLIHSIMDFLCASLEHRLYDVFLIVSVKHFKWKRTIRLARYSGQSIRIGQQLA